MNRLKNSNSVVRSVQAALVFPLMLLLGSPAAPAAEQPRFDFEYLPIALPERSAPQWALMQRAGTATLEDEKLAVHVVAGSRHYYAIGVTGSELTVGDAEAWRFSGGNMTVDFRLKVRSESPQVEAFRISLSDGVAYWPVIFREGTVEGKSAPVDEPDTYRVTISNGHMILSSERLGIIKERKSGLSGRGPSGTLISFGTFATNKEWPLEHGKVIEWELEYLRWTPAALPALGEN